MKDDHYFQPSGEFLARFPNVASVLHGAALQELQDARLSGIKIQPSATVPLPAVATPGKIICVGLNYKTHVADLKRDDGA